MRKLFSIILSLSMLLTPMLTSCSRKDVSVYVNGEVVAFDTDPVIKKGRILVDADEIFEELGAVMVWEAESQKLSAEKSDTNIHFYINKPEIYKDNTAKKIDVSPIIKGDRPFVPLRAVAEAFDCIVVWENKTRTIRIATDVGELEYTGEPYITINSNQPAFNLSDYEDLSFESYSKLDNLGRAGMATANIGLDIMPTEDRGNIGSVKPSGWQTVKYDFVDGKYLYNRCHLIGYQLTGENANERNLITGTRYMNVDGMLPFENEVAEYVEKTGNRVLYRVTPIYEEDNLLASGVMMEAYSAADDGEGVCFNVYCFNVQPGVDIDYATGKSSLAKDLTYDEPLKENIENTDSPTQYIVYILNVNSKKFHHPDCSGAASIKPQNKRESNKNRNVLIGQGYSPCEICKP